MPTTLCERRHFGSGAMRDGVGRAIGMPAECDSRSCEEGLVGDFEVGIIIKGLVVDDFANASLDGFFETTEARTQGDVEAGAVRRRALAGGKGDGVLLAVDAEAPVVAGLRDGGGGAAGTAALVTVFDAEGCAIVAGADDAAIHYDERADRAAGAVGAAGDDPGDVEVVVIPGWAGGFRHGILRKNVTWEYLAYGIMQQRCFAALCREPSVTSYHEMETSHMRIINEPEIYIVGRQSLDSDEVRRFLEDHETSWQTDSERGSELIVELAGRICYLSFGDKQFRKTNADYVGNLINQGHGSVLEHAVWDLLITGVSRSLTHELVRHRAGTGISQLSQRYVDESTADFVEPAIIAESPELHATWLRAIETAHTAYEELVAGLAAQVQKDHPELKRTPRLKMAREAARSVLPNATETKLLFSANARALRWIITLRGSDGAEPEIRRLAVKLARVMQREAPNLFGDLEIVRLLDGTEGVQVGHHKV
jgi:thymidylate synthase (FAD)